MAIVGVWKPGKKMTSMTFLIRSSIEEYSTRKLGEYGRSLDISQC
jgi:hypothetical protein